ncbi:MAG: uroporphyrinogen-III synthase [Archangium sp.]
MASVLLLTPPEQASDLAFLLEEEGHEARFWPLLGAPTELPMGLRAAAEQIGRFTWVVVMGRGPLRAFLEAVNGAGTRSTIPRVQWLASDAPTARVVERHGGTVRVPGDGKWTSAVSGLLTSDDELLVIHEDGVPEILADAFDAAGARFIDVQVTCAEPQQLEDAGDVRVVIVHSSAAGEAWAELTRGASHDEHDQYCCGPHEHHQQPEAQRVVVPEGVRVVAASEAAAETLRGLGVEVYVTAQANAADAVVDATLRALTE